MFFHPEMVRSLKKPAPLLYQVVPCAEAVLWNYGFASKWFLYTPDKNSTWMGKMSFLAEMDIGLPIILRAEEIIAWSQAAG
jgi:hypothetical protein